MARMPPSRRYGKFKPATLQAIPEEKSILNPLNTHMTSSSSFSSNISKPGSLTPGNQQIARKEQIGQEEMEEMKMTSPQDGFMPANISEPTSHTVIQTSADVKPHVLKEGKIDPRDIQLYGQKKAKKIAEGRIAIEDGKEYDMNFAKAVFFTAWVPWLRALLIFLAGSKYSCSS